MSKKYSYIIISIFCLFIFGISVLSLLLPEKEFSELENRYLASAPDFSVDSVMNGAFMKGAENYVSDHIAFRDKWVQGKALFERLSGKKENEGIYFAEDSTLIKRIDTPDEGQLEKKISYVNELKKNAGVPVYFGLIPTAAEVWGDKLPKNAPTADEKSIIEKLYSISEAENIDVAEALDGHRDEEIFYRTDHHWTSLGAYYGACAVFEKMGIQELNVEDYEQKTVSDSFYGTLYSTSGAGWIEPDRIDTYVRNDNAEVFSYSGKETVKTGLYDESFLAKKDKYSYFMGGNKPLAVVKTQNSELPKLLLIRDSYSDSLVPFLTERFSEIHMIDLRYNKSSIKDYIEENSIDTVLVLYGFSTFAESGDLFLLGN